MDRAELGFIIRDEMVDDTFGGSLIHYFGSSVSLVCSKSIEMIEECHSYHNQKLESI
jgi:hypothetical protein